MIAQTIQPHARDLLYANLHNQIEGEKINFAHYTSHLWNVPNFDATVLYNNDQNAYQWLCTCIEQFLRFMRFRIGDKDNIRIHNENE